MRLKTKIICDFETNMFY